MPTILFTGGGSAGHVTPNIALIHKFLQTGWQVKYVGSKQGIEKDIIASLAIPYYSITTGKLRRYFSWRTFIEPFAILIGVWQAFWLCQKIKPEIIFSKGGFVAFPIVVGAWLSKIPIVVHESDFTPGLANKLSFPFATKICVTFADNSQLLASKKTIVTGTPIRETLLRGNAIQGQKFCQFVASKAILLVLGGGQGSAVINQTIRKLLPLLTTTFQVIHICGRGKIANDISFDQSYKQFEYLNDELADVLACADIVISRAGANSLYELLYLRKPHILIPLSRKASRGDQIVNAQYFANKGLSTVLYEEELNEDNLLELIKNVYANRHALIKKLLAYSLPDSNTIIYAQLVHLANIQR